MSVTWDSMRSAAGSSIRITSFAEGTSVHPRARNSAPVSAAIASRRGARIEGRKSSATRIPLRAATDS